MTEQARLNQVIVIDTETGGLNPETDPLLVVAAVRLTDPEDCFFRAIRSYRRGSPDAERVHGLTHQWLQEHGEPEAAVLRAFAAWTGSETSWIAAGCHVAFDCAFIDAAARRCGVGARMPHRRIDVQSLAWRADMRGEIKLPEKNGRASFSLDSILAAIGRERPEGVHHALDDAKLTRDAIEELLYLPQCRRCNATGYMRNTGSDGTVWTDPCNDCDGTGLVQRFAVDLRTGRDPLPAIETTTETTGC